MKLHDSSLHQPRHYKPPGKEIDVEARERRISRHDSSQSKTLFGSYDGAELFFCYSRMTAGLVQAGKILLWRSKECCEETG